MDLEATQRVDWVMEGPLAGNIGLTMAPGRRDRGQAGQWARSLERDLNAIAMAGVKVLVCLVPDDELARVQERPAIKAALSNLAESDLDKSSPESMQGYAPTVGSAFVMIGGHWIMHAGQWAVIRRQLGREPLF